MIREDSIRRQEDSMKDIIKEENKENNRNNKNLIDRIKSSFNNLNNVVNRFIDYIIGPITRYYNYKKYPKFSIKYNINYSNDLDDLISNLDINKALKKWVRDLGFILHYGQKRVSGEPYITHPEFVAEKVMDVIINKKMKIEEDYQLFFSTIAYAGAILHDAVEDTPLTTKGLEKLLENLNEKDWRAIIFVVDELTRKKHESYKEYLDRILESNTDYKNINYKETNHKEYSRQSNKNFSTRELTLLRALIVTIKVYDILHNIKTMNDLPIERRILQEDKRTKALGEIIDFIIRKDLIREFNDPFYNEPSGLFIKSFIDVKGAIDKLFKGEVLNNIKFAREELTKFLHRVITCEYKDKHLSKESKLKYENMNLNKEEQFYKFFRNNRKGYSSLIRYLKKGGNLKNWFVNYLNNEWSIDWVKAQVYYKEFINEFKTKKPDKRLEIIYF